MHAIRLHFFDSAQCAAPIVAETMPKSLRMCGADLRLEGVRDAMPLHSNLDSGTSKCDMLQELKKRVLAEKQVGESRARVARPKILVYIYRLLDPDI